MEENTSDNIPTDTEDIESAPGETAAVKQDAQEQPVEEEA
jgi:hypothetical protein